MSIITEQQQAETDQLAQDYVQLHAMKVALKLARERDDRLQKSLLAAVMHAECGDYHRVKEILYQALNFMSTLADSSSIPKVPKL